MINFLSGGKVGDFIHTLFAAKNICEQKGKRARIFLGGGDDWTFGVNRAYKDLYSLVMMQPYVESFHVYGGEKIDINLNSWRDVVATVHAETGHYDSCWTELLMKEYDIDPPDTYKWLTAPKDDSVTKGKVVIHFSLRHDTGLEIERYMGNDAVFITSNYKEWLAFPYRDWAYLHYLDNITDMANAINSSSLFIGNQSSMFAIASALDVPRIVGLHPDAAPFYIGECKYSDNISWYLSSDIQKMKV